VTFLLTMILVNMTFPGPFSTPRLSQGATLLAIDSNGEFVSETTNCILIDRNFGLTLGPKPAEAFFPVIGALIGLAQYITSTLISMNPIHDPVSEGYQSFRQVMTDDIAGQVGLPELAPDPQKAGAGFYAFTGISNNGQSFALPYIHFYDPNPDQPDWAEVRWEGVKEPVRYTREQLRDGAVIDVQTPPALPYGHVRNYKCVFSYPNDKKTPIWGWVKYRTLGQVQAEHYLKPRLGKVVAASSPTDSPTVAQEKQRQRTTPLIIQAINFDREVEFYVIDQADREIRSVKLSSQPNQDVGRIMVKPGLVVVAVGKSDIGRIHVGRKPDVEGRYYLVPAQGEPYVLNASTQPFPEGGK